MVFVDGLVTVPATGRGGRGGPRTPETMADQMRKKPARRSSRQFSPRRRPRCRLTSSRSIVSCARGSHRGRPRMNATVRPRNLKGGSLQEARAGLYAEKSGLATTRMKTHFPNWNIRRSLDGAFLMMLEKPEEQFKSLLSAFSPNRTTELGQAIGGRKSQGLSGRRGSRHLRRDVR